MDKYAYSNDDETVQHLAVKTLNPELCSDTRVRPLPVLNLPLLCDLAHHSHKKRYCCCCFRKSRSSSRSSGS